MSEFKHVGDGLYIRRLPNGEYHGKKVERSRESNRAKRNMRRGSEKASDHEAPAGMRHVASLSPAQAAAMQEETGGDPDKEKAWLRDHPENLVCKKGQADLPKKKITVY